MRTVFLRACRDTASALGWNGRTLVVGALLVAFGKGANIFRLGFEPAMTSVMDWIYSAVIPIAATFLLLFAYNLWLAPLRIAREERVGQPTPSRTADITLYQGLDHYRLDEVACLWFGIEPEDPVTDSRAKAMLARLKHAYIDGNIRKHQNDDMHSFLVLLTKFHGSRPPNSERVTAPALRQYAEAIGDIPAFLQSVQVPAVARQSISVASK